MSSRAVAETVVDDNPSDYEEKNVHAVYDEIASHFSSTRYKVRPDNTVLLITTTPSLAVAHHRSVYFESAYWLGRLGLWHRKWKILAPASR
jgi:hypothetical protein